MRAPSHAQRGWPHSAQLSSVLQACSIQLQRTALRWGATSSSSGTTGVVLSHQTSLPGKHSVQDPAAGASTRHVACCTPTRAPSSAWCPATRRCRQKTLHGLLSQHSPGTSSLQRMPGCWPITQPRWLHTATGGACHVGSCEEPLEQRILHTRAALQSRQQIAQTRAEDMHILTAQLQTQNVPVHLCRPFLWQGEVYVGHWVKLGWPVGESKPPPELQCIATGSFGAHSCEFSTLSRLNFQTRQLELRLLFQKPLQGTRLRCACAILPAREHSSRTAAQPQQ